jgi:hypothetical protein
LAEWNQTKYITSMDPRSRAAVIRRITAVLGSDKPAPNSWAELNTTEQLLLQSRDPEVVQILQGQMSPEVEIACLTGKLADTFTGQTFEQQREQARQEYLAAAEQRMAEEIEQMHSRQQDAAGQQAARQLSEQLAQQQLTAQARRAGRGW